MDLFNPPKTFNYKIMIKDLEFSKFENPPIQVVWEDISENFTQDKIKSVKHYFQKKYGSTNVNVITKVKNRFFPSKPAGSRVASELYESEIKIMFGKA